MTTRDFVYWLQGFVEIVGRKPTSEEWEIIKDHVLEAKTPTPKSAPKEFDIEAFRKLQEDIKRPQKTDDWFQPTPYPYAPPMNVPFTPPPWRDGDIIC